MDRDQFVQLLDQCWNDFRRQAWEVPEQRPGMPKLAFTSGDRSIPRTSRRPQNGTVGQGAAGWFPSDSGTTRLQNHRHQSPEVPKSVSPCII